MEDEEKDIDTYYTGIKRKIVFAALICFIILTLTTVIFCVAPYFFPEGISYRYGFDSRVTGILLFLWIVVEIIIDAILVNKVKSRFEKSVLVRWTLNSLIIAATVFLMLHEVVIWFGHGLEQPYEVKELDNGNLYMLSSDFLDPYHYYSKAINGILQKELSREDQKILAAKYFELDIDEEGIMGIKKPTLQFANASTVHNSGNEDSSDELDESLQKYDENKITQEQMDSYKKTCDASDAYGFNKFDDFDEIIQKDITGTWYAPDNDIAIRLFEDKTAYLYFPIIDYYGDVAYKWEYVDRSSRGLCPALIIDTYGYEGNGVMFYIAGIRDDYFWCNEQGQIFYKQ